MHLGARDQEAKIVMPRFLPAAAETVVEIKSLELLLATRPAPFDIAQAVRANS